MARYRELGFLEAKTLYKRATRMRDGKSDYECPSAQPKRFAVELQRQVVENLPSSLNRGANHRTPVCICAECDRFENKVIT